MYFTLRKILSIRFFIIQLSTIFLCIRLLDHTMAWKDCVNIRDNYFPYRIYCRYKYTYFIFHVILLFYLRLQSLRIVSNIMWMWWVVCDYSSERAINENFNDQLKPSQILLLRQNWSLSCLGLNQDIKTNVEYKWNILYL